MCKDNDGKYSDVEDMAHVVQRLTMTEWTVGYTSKIANIIKKTKPDNSMDNKTTQNSQDISILKSTNLATPNPHVVSNEIKFSVSVRSQHNTLSLN